MWSNKLVFLIQYFFVRMCKVSSSYFATFNFVKYGAFSPSHFSHYKVRFEIFYINFLIMTVRPIYFSFFSVRYRIICNLNIITPRKIWIDERNLSHFCNCFHYEFQYLFMNFFGNFLPLVIFRINENFVYLCTHSKLKIILFLRFLGVGTYYLRHRSLNYFQNT